MHMHTHTCGWTCSCMCLCESRCFHLLHTSVCKYVYMLCLCIHMYKCTYICMLLNMYVWLNVYMFVCTHACTSIPTHIHLSIVYVWVYVYMHIYIHVSLSGTATCYKDQVCINQWWVPAVAASTESSGKFNPEWWHLRKQTLVKWGNILWFKKQVAINSVSKYVLGPYLALRCHTGNWGYQGEDDPVLSLEELSSW